MTKHPLYLTKNSFEPWTRAQEEKEGEEGTKVEEQTPAEEIIPAIWVYDAVSVMVYLGL